MLNNFSIIRLIIISYLVVLFPYVQKQWFNLYQFNSNSSSFYSILFYLSGLIFPLFVIYNSIFKFTYYNFNIQTNNFRNSITGKKLLIISSLGLIIFSIFIANYFYINFDLIIKLFFINFQLPEINLFQQLFIIFILCILLVFRRTKILMKKLALVNFFVISLLIWYSQINRFPINDEYQIRHFLKLENINYINIIYLFIIESFYFFWSYISYNNNLSDWSVPLPSQKDTFKIIKIIIFYFFTIIYYSIIEQ